MTSCPDSISWSLHAATVANSRNGRALGQAEDSVTFDSQLVEEVGVKGARDRVDEGGQRVIDQPGIQPRCLRAVAGHSNGPLWRHREHRGLPDRGAAAPVTEPPRSDIQKRAAGRRQPGIDQHHARDCIGAVQHGLGHRKAGIAMRHYGDPFVSRPAP